MKKLIALFMLMCGSVMAAGTSGWHYVQYDGTNLATVQGAGTTILFKASEVQTNASSGAGWTNTWGPKAFTNLGLNVQSIPGSGIVVTNQGSTNSIGVDYGFADVTNPIVGSTGWTPADTNYSRDATHLTNTQNSAFDLIKSTNIAVRTNAMIGFIATRSYNQTNALSATAYTAKFDTEIYDSDSGYNPTTYKYTVPRTGRWLVNSFETVEMVDDAKSAVILLQVIVGGVAPTNSLVYSKMGSARADNSVSPIVSTITNLVAGDVIYSIIYDDNTGRDVYFRSGNSYSGFSAVFMDTVWGGP